MDVFAAIDARDEAAALAAVRAAPHQATARHPGTGVTPVLYALYHGQVALAHQLAGTGDGLDLAEAAALDHTDRVAALLDGGAAPDGRTPDGYTPLHLAAFFGAPGATALLLRRGADVHAVADNEMRVQALHSAAAGRHLEVARLLLAAGADPGARQRHGYAALHSAAASGQDDLVQALLAAGADAAAATDDGRTAAQLARAGGHDALADRLDRAAAA